MNNIRKYRKVKILPVNPANRKNLDKFEMDVEYGNVLMGEEE